MVLGISAGVPAKGAIFCNIAGTSAMEHCTPIQVPGVLIVLQCLPPSTVRWIAPRTVA